MERRGKGSRISDLMFNLDARATSVHVTDDFDVDEARAFSDAGHNVTGYWPFMQQFWQALGPRGAITFYDRGWYSVAAERTMCRAFGGLNPKRKEGKKGTVRGDQLAARKEAGVCLASIREFERGLVDERLRGREVFIHVSAEGRGSASSAWAADPPRRGASTRSVSSALGTTSTPTASTTSCSRAAISRSRLGRL